MRHMKYEILNMNYGAYDTYHIVIRKNTVKKAPAPRFCGAAYLSDPLRVELMTMNYCGRCGSANGATARFCRQCGADLSSQAATSSSSAPFNVEFSTKSVKKNREKESSPASPKKEPYTEAGSAPDRPSHRTTAAIAPPKTTESPKSTKTPENSETSNAPGTSGTLGTSKAAEAAEATEAMDQNPKAISDSLRRIRASGPLILA